MKKKAVILLVGLFALLGAACLSMARVMHGEEYVAAARAQSLYKLDIAQSRGTIYDCGLQPLVGGETEYVAAVAPTIQAIGALEKATGGQYRQQLAVALENGRPFQLVLEQPVDNPLVQVFRVPQRYSQEQLAPHVVGYLDSLDGGAAGIELAMDDVLSQCGGEISVTYRVDAVGRVLAGEEPQVVNTLEESAAGVALTLDSAIQRLAQQAAQKLGKGAVVVTEAPGCKIRAVASVPDFSPLDLSEATQREDAPLVNRAFSAYAPGSVFKVAVAAALLEEGLGELTFTCVGSLNAGGLQFHCVDSTAHGELDLEGALAHSCNCYFINAARVLGGQEILSMAYNLGFGSAQEFGRGLWTAAGELPTLQSLGNARALANWPPRPCRCAPCSTSWPAAASTPPPSCWKALSARPGSCGPCPPPRLSRPRGCSPPPPGRCSKPCAPPPRRAPARPPRRRGPRWASRQVPPKPACWKTARSCCTFGTAASSGRGACPGGASPC